MIVHEFNWGWGPDWQIKQFEIEIVNQYLHPLNSDTSKTLVINSCWYDNQWYANKEKEHFQRQVEGKDFDQIVLVSMLDAAIPQPRDFEKFQCPIFGVGYYPGPYEIDFWALVVDKFYPTYSCQELNDPSAFDMAYMCLNRKPHPHRRRLYRKLNGLNLLDAGLVSMGSSEDSPPRLIPNDEDTKSALNLAPNGYVSHYGIANDIASLGSIKNWQRCFLNIVTETNFQISKYHFVSEKIYKPILGMRPFLVYADDGGVDWLHSHGFETFVNDFKDISDLDLAMPDNIPNFLQQLCDAGLSYWKSKYIALNEKILHNKNQFEHHVQSNKDKIKKGIPCQL